MQQYFNSTGYKTQGMRTELTGATGQGTLNMANEEDKDSGYLPTTFLVPQNETGAGIRPEDSTYPVIYTLNASVPSGPGIIPYNSTLWFKNTSHPLDAPFLTFGPDCVDYTGYRADGACLCFRRSPLKFDWASAENMVCMSGTGYSWGFSSFVVLLGLALEVAWVSICYMLWLDANLNSRLLRHRRSAYGVFRSSLDLAEAVRRELGDSTSAYANADLKKALEGREEIGFSVEEERGAKHVGIVPRSRKKPGLRGWVMEQEEYG